jgi:predicted nucleic acid-binding protein
VDEQQQQRINEAAEKFADAMRESYRAVAKRGASAQELNAELTQQFFNTVIDNLRTQARDTREMTQQLVDQQRAQEAGKVLTQETLGAYMKLMDYMFSYYHLLVATRAKVLR